jgi:nicotinate-nucleotide adenylyltransferase
MSVKRLGIFGGTFDPVHFGHLWPALGAQRAFGFDRLVFVPAVRPPHKLTCPRTAFHHRVAMLALATQEHEHLVVSDIESERAGPSFTLDTVSAVGERWPAEHVYFLMGSDSFVQIETWYRWEELVERVHLVVLHRDTAWDEELVTRTPARLRERLVRVAASGPVPDPAPGPPSIYLLAHQPFPISSTQLRECLRAGGDAGDLLPPAVLAYARKCELYHQGVTPTDGR